MQFKSRLKVKTLLFQYILLVLLFSSCQNQDSGKIESVLDDYYQIYNERSDIDKFLELFDENVVFEDIINGDKFSDKDKLKTFFDWENSNFTSLGDKVIVVENRIIQGNRATVSGYFEAFKWGEYEFEAMHFTTNFIFNESNKIVRQTDWINYPSGLVDYNNRKNSNQWIKE